MLIGPVIIQGREPSNVIELINGSTGALVMMRRPAMVRSQNSSVRWSVGCQAQMLLNDRVFVTVPAHPRRRGNLNELLLPPLPVALRAVAVAYFPMEVLGWRLEFFADQPEHPDAKAEVWVRALVGSFASCGIFRTPCREART